MILSLHLTRANNKMRESRRPRRAYPTQWHKLAARFRKENPHCRLCWELTGRVTIARHTDHVVPLRRDWDFPELLDKANLQSLCVACHHAKTDREMRIGRARWEVQPGLVWVGCPDPTFRVRKSGYRVASPEKAFQQAARRSLRLVDYNPGRLDLEPRKAVRKPVRSSQAYSKKG